MRLRDEYYLIDEQNKFLVVYNIKSDKPYKIIKWDELKIKEAIEINSMDNIEETRIFKMIYKKYPELFEDSKQCLNNALIKKYIDLISGSAPMSNHMLEINLRRLFLYKPILVLSKTKISLNGFLNVENIKEYKFVENGLYIIEDGLLSHEHIKYMENEFLKNGNTRIYFSEVEDSLQVGPGLIGEDYGCYFCMEKINRKPVGIIGELMVSSIIQRDLPLFCTEFLELMQEDLTVTKGKVFNLEYKNFKGRAVHLKRNAACYICGRKL